MPCGFAPPGPSSSTSTTRRPLSSNSDDLRRGAAGVLGGVGQRLGDDEVGGGLDDRREPAVEPGVDLHRQRAALAERLDGGRQAAVGQHRRGDAAGQVAQLLDGVGGLDAGVAHQLGGLGVIVQAVLGAAELHAQRDQAGLRAVVQVALDPAQLGGLGVQRAAAGAGEHVDALGQLLLAHRVQRAPPGGDQHVQDQRRAHPEQRPEQPEAEPGQRPR